MLQHPEEKTSPGPKEALAVAAAKKSPRRPDIDVIRIVLTWLILVYHTLLIYRPDSTYYLKIFPDTGVDSWMNIGFMNIGEFMNIGFCNILNAWNMPMFFFLSGIRKGNISFQ